MLALFSWRVLMFGSVCFVLVAISMDFYSSKVSKATADVQDAILSFFKASHVSSAGACARIPPHDRPREGWDDLKPEFRDVVCDEIACAGSVTIAITL